jgi:hypothetical protein
MVLDPLIEIFKTSLTTDVITGIGGIFGFITSFLSIVITQTFDRRALTRWRSSLWFCMVGLWAGVILVILDLIKTISIQPYQNLGTKFGVIAWILGLSGLMYIFWQISRLETIRFNKPSVSFSSSSFPSFDIDCIDSVIKKALSEKGRVIYPIILAADESWRPWEVAKNFSASAVKNNIGVIWFWFARPPYEIDKARNRVDIDCFSPFAGKAMKDNLANGLLYADPRNPHNMNEKYEKAIKHLMHFESLCVIYDALSDFLFFSDEEIASQYLRHNMSWEEKNNVRSLYIFRKGTLKSELEQYILWFANTVITLTTDEKGNPIMKTRGLFRDPECFKTDYDLKLCDQISCKT